MSIKIALAALALVGLGSVAAPAHANTERDKACMAWTQDAAALVDPTCTDVIRAKWEARGQDYLGVMGALKQVEDRLAAQEADAARRIDYWQARTRTQGEKVRALRAQLRALGAVPVR